LRPSSLADADERQTVRGALVRSDDMIAEGAGEQRARVEAAG
jgi:hypothetical protein